ncbi:MAG TPA: hypothetical protein VMT38_04760 [Terracidiphilus sp.]|nr:hypothetical protein [Terracidiphilus sp.]
MAILAYVVAAAIGYALGHYVLEGAAAAYASILVSYHLFLGFLVFAADQKKGFSIPILQTIVTHLAVLGLLIALPYMRAHVPFFGFVTLLVPGLAPFEVKWLFSGDGKVTEDHAGDTEVPMQNASAEEHEAFRDYLLGKERAFRKPGMSVNQEFNLWIKARAGKKAQASV